MPYHQRGQALIAITALLGITLLVTVYTITGSGNQTAINNQKTADALAQAKTALIGYAASKANPTGGLPCPDVTDDGNSDSCRGAVFVGRLPWQTLGLPDLRDGSGERLWYALSPVFQDGSSITSNTSGQLTVVDNTSDAVVQSNVIAIIFSPGPVVSGQTRDTAGENNILNYLEGKNNDGDSLFASGSSTDNFNDGILVITQHDLFAVVDKSIFARIAGNSSSSTGLQWYVGKHGNYPCAAGADGKSTPSTPPCLPSSDLVPYVDLGFDSTAEPWNAGWLNNGVTDYAVSSPPSPTQATVHFFAADHLILTTCTADSSGTVCR